jgi:hypothetical protein
MSVTKRNNVHSCHYIHSRNWLIKIRCHISKVKMSLCLTNWTLSHEGVWRSGNTDPCFLDLGTSWNWVVSFMPRPLYPRTNFLRYPFDWRLCGPRRQYDMEKRKISLLLVLNSDPSIIQPVASRYTDCADVNTRYCHALVTRHGVRNGNWIYWTQT